MESIIIRTTYDAKCLYSPNVREQLGAMARVAMGLTAAQRKKIRAAFTYDVHVGLGRRYLKTDDDAMLSRTVA